MSPVVAMVVVVVGLAAVLWGGAWLLGVVEGWIQRRRRERLRW